MTEQLILITTISALISLIVGALLATFFLPKLLKGIFKDTAREELDELTQEVKDSQKENEVSISRSMKELEKTILDAKTVWKTNTGDIVQEFRLLNRGFLAWEEALSNPGEQGALAEEGLEIMLEAAGLIKGVSFDTQITEHNDDGKIVRPDFYVYTPEEGVIIIDSKAPMTHYKNAIQADNENKKREALSNHANSMYTYAQQLGQREYTLATSRNTPDMVIMYVPNLAVYLAAIEARPTLIEEAWSHKVQICPPEAIYPVLKSIMLSWQQKKLYENVEEMHKQTIVIHDRLKKFHTHFSGIGKALTNASKTFNNSVRSWESRLKPAIRKLEEMGIADPSREIGSTESIEEQTRDISDK